MSKLIANFGCNNNYAMKTNKEYPATHSMSMAWFAADEDGNYLCKISAISKNIAEILHIP